MIENKIYLTFILPLIIVCLAIMALLVLYWSVKTPYQDEIDYIFYEYIEDKKILIIYFNQEKVMITDVKTKEEAEQIIKNRFKGI
jgi:signal transduction histidine kinase